MFATTVVTLNEHASGIARPRRHSPVPYVGHEEGNVTHTGNDRHYSLAVPLQVVVSQAVNRRGLP